jgi:metal-responsive CopG/Arc/MetJ family transcriptional regulator
MPRKPTGNPRGRPKGTGRLGEQTRLTIRIPQELYTRLEAFAEGRSYTRGTPQLAVCVREALEHYLAGSYKRQTRNVHITDEPNIGQTENTPLHQEELKRQTENITELCSTALIALEEQKRQTIIVPEIDIQPEGIQRTVIRQPINEQEDVQKQITVETDNRQTENSTSAVSVPPFDHSKYVLGKLCPRGHDYHDTGTSLLRRANSGCLECDREKARERRANRQKTKK